MRVKCHKIVGGQAEGDALITSQPINFLTMFTTGNGCITDQNHQLFGRSVKGAVLVFPNGVGSSVGAYTIYSLRCMNVAPVAVICTRQTDIITASGCAISNIPLVQITEDIALSSVHDRFRILVDADNEILFVKKNKRLINSQS